VPEQLVVRDRLVLRTTGTMCQYRISDRSSATTAIARAESK